MEKGWHIVRNNCPNFKLIAPRGAVFVRIVQLMLSVLRCAIQGQN